VHPNDYQKATEETEIYTDASEAFMAQIIGARTSHDTLRDTLSVMYCAGKLNGEAGEVAEVVFKGFRGDNMFVYENGQKMLKELGDVMWYVARLADLYGISLEELMQNNLDKLADRKKRGVIHGYGDER
jgi:NTP pyrophosphatase (non-canonical NTP hydrolase)